MDSNPQAVDDLIRSRIRKILEQAPTDADARESWIQQALDAVCAPLEELNQQVRQLQFTNNLLQSGNAGFISVQKQLEEENERQKAATALEHRLLEAIIAADPGGIAVVSGSDYVYQMANEAHRAVLPHPEMDPIGRKMDEVWPWAEGFMGSRLVQPVIEEQASFTLNRLQRRYPDGEMRSFTFHARPIDWNGRPSVLMVTWETTELEKALEKAEEGQRMLDVLMDYIPEGISITSAPDYCLQYISKYAAGMVLRDRSDMEGTDLNQFLELSRLYHADGATRVAMQELPSFRASRYGEVIQDEEYILGEPGSQTHVLVNAGPICDAEGNIFASVAVLRDITEQKREEENQRFLSDLGRRLVSLRSPDDMLSGITTSLGEYLDVDHCFISEDVLGNGQLAILKDYCKNVTSLHGLSQNLWLDSGLSGRLHKARLVIVGDLKTAPLTSAVYETIYAPLETRALVCVPWLNSENQLVGALSVISGKPRIWRQDEVALLQAVADLARLGLENVSLFKDLQDFRCRFEVALRNSPITVMTLNRDLRIIWAFKSLYGYESKLVIGKREDELITPEDAAPINALEREVLASGISARKEFAIHLGDGIYQFDTTIEPLRDEHGQISGIMVVSMDVTKQRRMEVEAIRNLTRIEVQRRLIAERELERTRIARELHDGPLQDLIATSFNLVEAMDINEKDLRLAKMRVIQGMVQKQVQELRRFCNDLRPPVLAPFGLEKTIRSHAEGLRDLRPDLHLTLRLERDGQLLPEEVRMTLFRVYQELINNVLRHSKASEVTIHLYLPEGWAVLEVEDNGVGFSAPENWADLAHHGHLGLVGLQERVQMVGGKAEINAAPGAGTHVRVSVPR